MHQTLNELPSIFLRRLSQILNEADFNRVSAQFSQTPPFAVRVNTLLDSPDALVDEFAQSGISLKSIPWRNDTFATHGFHRNQIVKSRAITEGRIYLQDLSSILAAHLLAARPGEENLDLAAAPGGKTLVMASDMRNEGRIAAIESVKSRFFRLKSNITLYGATCVNLYLKDGRKVGRRCPDRFDRVLLDAPCSSEARFHLSDPNSYRYWSEKKILEAQRKQKQLLYSAIDATKPGGKILYCTCSFAPEENEAVIDRQLQIWGDSISPVAIAPPLANVRPGLESWKKQRFDPALTKAVRILPNGQMRGFFMCLLHKESGTNRN